MKVFKDVNLKGKFLPPVVEIAFGGGNWKSLI